VQGLSTKIKYLRRTASAAAGNGLGTAIQHLVNHRHRPGHHDQVPATHSVRRRGQRPGHHDQFTATHNEQRRGQQPGRHGQLPATNNERCRGRQPGHHDQVPKTLNEQRHVQGLSTKIKYLRRTASAATGNGLGTAIQNLVNQNAGSGNNWAKAHYTMAVHDFC